VFEAHTSLKRFLRENMYRHEQVRTMNERTRAMVHSLFDSYMSDPFRMPGYFAGKAAGDTANRARVVADYIAGMTDRFAIAEYERLAG
jgi:dGTPase